MSRKRVAIAYMKVALGDDIDALTRNLEAFCKRRRITLLDRYVAEASTDQPKLQRLLASIRAKKHVDLIVVPSLFHLGELQTLYWRLFQLHQVGVGAAFAQEKLVLVTGAAVFGFSEKWVEAKRAEKSRNIKTSLRIASLYGRQLGKPRLPEVTRRQAESYLRAGHSLRKVEKLMSRSISRSTLSLIAREMRKKGEL